MSGYLELADGEVIAVRDGLLLGRVASCDVVIADTKASRRHARVIVESGVVEIEDMGSSNGTRLNGKPVERRMLRDGDRVEIGKTVVTYREGAMPGRSRPAAAAAPASDDLFGDDDDLLAAGAPDDDAPAPAPAASAAPAPSVGADEEDDDDLLTTAPAPAGDVVEFEDEVVEVAKAPPPRREEPLVQTRAPARGQAKATDDVQPSSGRILQYSKKAGGSGVLGDDLGQMSGGKRALLVLLVVAVGGGIVYGVMTALR